MLTFGSVCSGIEAASVAWEPLGWRAVWFAEVDKAASAVLAYRYPNVPNLGDMTALAEKVRAREIAAPDVLVGGTPCQDFSVAGKRAGLDGARGQLTLAFILLADAIDEVRRADGLPPVIIVWENVPGVLTHKNNPFGNVLAGFAGEDEALVPAGKRWTNAGVVLGPERAVAWRELDAQYFELAQRRRRVFVVASAREGFDPAGILFEFEGVRRDSPPRREAGEGFTHAVAPCLTSSGRGVERTGDPRGQDAVVAVGRVLGAARVAATLDASYGKLQGCSGQDANHGHSHLVPVAFGGNNQSGPIDVATACNAHGGPHGRLDFESETFIVDQAPICFSSKDYGADALADALADLSPTLRAGGHDGSHANAGVPPAIAFYPTNRNPEDGNCVGFAPTLTAGNGAVPGVAYSVALRGREGGATAELGDDLAGCLRASSGGGDKPHVLAPCYPINPNALREGEAKTPSPDAEGRIRLRNPGLGIGADGDPADTITAAGPGYVAAAVLPFDTTQITSKTNRSQPDYGDPCHPLAAGAHPPAIAHEEHAAMAVRRLMPVECERLQGFEDNWTLVPVGKNKNGTIRWAADGPRYKQCGNSMATHVMAWIGARIDAHLRSLIGHNGGPPLDEFDLLLGAEPDPLEALFG